jgi:hypothetical protein
MTDRYDEVRVSQLLRMLPQPPRAWVEAAVELPAARAAIDSLVERALADERLRRRLVEDLEAALAAEGVEPTPLRLDALRRRLSDR